MHDSSKSFYSMEIRKATVVTFFAFLFSIHDRSIAMWVKSGYWYAGSDFPVTHINSALFSHLICGFAEVNFTTYELSIAPNFLRSFSTFTSIVKQKNPSVITLLSVWNGQAQTYRSILGEKVLNNSVLSSMLADSSRRKTFVDSSLKTARLYGFQGIDLFWLWPNSTDLSKMGSLLDEWKAAISSESRNSSQEPLILTIGVRYSPSLQPVSYPIEAIRRNVDWAHIVAYDYHKPSRENFTGNHAALYNPSSNITTDFGIQEWLSRGFPPSKLVLGLPYHGYAWTLVNPSHTSVGSQASGPAVTLDGSVGYRFIKSFIQNFGYGAKSTYNSTYVVNYFVVGSTWINYDDVETVKAKIGYVKGNGMIGFNVYQVGNDDNWALTLAAQDDVGKGNKGSLLLKVLLPIALTICLLVSFTIYYYRSRFLRKIESIGGSENACNPVVSSSAGERLDNNGPPLQIFSFHSIKAATNNFSSENKLGEGGFGPVYKGKLSRGQEIAVKRLSASSNQGLEEFKNEISLTSKLQHVNLVRLLGFCTEREEKLLIYECMPNRSLDFYLYDPIRRHQLEWSKRVQIIEGITQGLLYLQEYSNVTIIHRDLKASNILLDKDMNPKISDFGMAKLFRRDVHEENTNRIVGTYGYLPPEYLRKGIYSMKYDVYSFGILLLQIISGKRNACYYGPSENLNLSEYAYDLWRSDRGMEFIDQSLDDSSSDCKLMRCLQVALLCVQEDPVDRPSMLEVFSMLKSNALLTSVPKIPAFSIKGQEKEGTSSTHHREIYSFNDEEMSQVEPR